ncbi:MAG TPA: DNA-binding domain-containing protein [Steroidobacteraceae bacterium]
MSMGHLPQIQGDFQSYLLRGDATIEAHVVGTERVPVATRLSIYGDGYVARLTEALQANFPVLGELLGEADFAQLATTYVRSHDSPFFSIRYYGNALADFLATDSGYASAPVLAEIARWEWAMTEVFDAADADPLGVSDLANVAPDEWAMLRFGLHPSVRRLALAWNAPQIWKAVSDGGEPPEVEFSPEPVEWLLWRQDLRTYFRSLQPGEAGALEAAREGRSFGELCGLLCAEFGEEAAPARAAAFLRDWVESGLLTVAG